MDKLRIFLISIFIFSAFSSFSQKNRIIDFKIYYDKAARLAPGSVVPIGVMGQKINGKEFYTKGFLEGKEHWKKFVVDVKGGTFDDGNVKISPSLSQIENDEIKINVSLEDDPSMQRTLTIKLNYIFDFTANFTGETGRHGVDGRDGSSGSQGSNGSPGENGRNGEDVEVYVKLIEADSNRYLKILVKSKSSYKREVFKVNVNGGKITIDVSGGKGGTGGRGGDGGNGVGTGVGGNGGYGANGGDGGNGGSIRLFADPAAEKYLSMILYNYNGGKGGDGGRKGRGGYAGSNYNSTNQNKTLVGQILTSQGHGKPGEAGYSGREGGIGPQPETYIQFVTEEF